jgi:hypothetical protein
MLEICIVSADVDVGCVSAPRSLSTIAFSQRKHCLLEGECDNENGDLPKHLGQVVMPDSSIMKEPGCCEECQTWKCQPRH